MAAAMTTFRSSPLSSLSSFLFLFVFLFAALAVSSSHSMSAPPPNNGSWVLVFEDDFTGSELNSSVWNIQNFTIHGTTELEIYMADQVYLENGTYLVLKTEAGNVTYSSGVHYNFVSGEVTTKEKFYHTYGMWEIRAKMPSQKATGVWPALWMMPNPSTANPPNVCWPVGGEIDILEQVGNPLYDPVWGSYHWGTSCDEDNHPLPGAPYPKFGSPSIDFSQDFHLFAVTWNATQITYYVDGVEYYTRTAEEVNIPQDPFYMIINTAISPLYPPEINDPSYPCYHYVDWFRVYDWVAN
eukprot:TRINITY_DN11938_c0_g1_i1.p1 TRINITY_DN11938_c0_g1~~TRINITY_DN11938_c0_g1_i1.p1  ORF type:complete len:297 (-),score=69.76 TRINITY_DN11938_c0_g1_i1:124-1014(-)